MFISIIRYVLVLFFGVFISSAFLDIKPTKKNFYILLVFSLFILAVQGLFLYFDDLQYLYRIYPLITHLPLLLFFIIIYKKQVLSSMLAICISYLCCQLSNWISKFSISMQSILYTEDLIYIITLLLSTVIIVRYVIKPISNLLLKPPNTLKSFCIIPFFYYIFDYVGTVYTDLLYSGNIIAIEFSPFLLCISYLVFCTVYFRQYEENQEIENLNKLMKIKQEETEKEIATILRSEKAMSIIRHDMRHFLNNISNYLEHNEIQEAQKYINDILSSVEKTARKKYCNHETLNMIISSYHHTMVEEFIHFDYDLQISSQLNISAVDLSSILSNGLENAIHAVSKLDKENRYIYLQMVEKNGRLLICIKNTYMEYIEFVDGMPVSKEKNHGFGTQSIKLTTEKLHGNYRFSLEGNMFILQVIL